MNTQGFIQTGVRNLQRWRLSSPCEQLVLLLDCPHGFFSQPTWTFLVSAYPHCLLSCNHAPVFRAWLCLLGNLLVGLGQLLWDFPKAFIPAGWTNPVPWAVPHRTSGPTPWGHDGPHWAHSTLLMSYVGGPELDEVFQMRSSECSADGDNIQHKIHPALHADREDCWFKFGLRFTRALWEKCSVLVVKLSLMSYSASLSVACISSLSTLVLGFSPL